MGADHERVARAKEIFADALERPAPDRLTLLDAACGEDSELRAMVNALLDAHGSAERFMYSPTAAQEEAAAAPRREAPGSLIGPYKLLEQIGEGGFGTVWMAEQREPVQRRVAVKVIKLGMDTRQVIARFEAERQALAMMDHPNIARVLDGGATDAQSPLGPGRPYFVMELVRGVPVTRFCDDQQLPLRDRLALFSDVCHAVQHAHQKGVIHRDLKPSNVLVSRYDDKRVVKIIDFGIAKAIGGRLTDKTLFTELRQMIGTPAYMSPEQAGLSDLDVDTRSDVYSLGVLLYELLTSTTPFDEARLRSADFDELRRIIRVEEPPRPSTRVALSLHQKAPDSPVGHSRSEHDAPARDKSSATEGPARASPDSSAAGAIAALGRSGPQALARALRGDLDWIVMKCLEKDRTRRYETANGLALEVERYLKHEPVLAGPPSRAYRLRKFVRRNRVMVTAASVVAVSLLVGTGGTTFGLLRAEQRRAQAEAAEGREREQRELAESREKQTQQVSEFQAGMLTGIDVEEMGRTIKDRFREQVRAALAREHVGEGSDRRERTTDEIEAELAVFDQRAGAALAVDVARGVMDEFVLARAAEALQGRFADQPLVEAQLRFAIGRAYRELGMYGAAETQLRASVELWQRQLGRQDAHPDIARVLSYLAAVLADQGRFQDSEALWRDVLAAWRELADAEQMAIAMEGLGNALFKQKSYSEAESMAREALRLNRKRFGEDHASSIGALASLAALLTSTGHFREAEEMMRQVNRWRREHFGDTHPQVAHALYNLGACLQDQSRHAEAVEAFRESLAVYRAVYGENHPLVAKCLSKLAYQLTHLGQHDEAEGYFRQALEQQRQLLGDLHPDVRDTLRRLSVLRKQQGDHEGAVELLRQMLASAERAFPEGHPESYQRLAAMGLVGGALASQARQLLPTDPERALALFKDADLLLRGGLGALSADRRSGSPENERMWAQRVAEMYEFWDGVAPGNGWADRAAEWRAELEKLAGP